MQNKVEEYLDTNIKDIMDQYPQVQDILDSFDIGCAPCTSGTCMMRDIIDIHNLDEQNEKTMLSQIFDVIFPGEKVEIPRIAKEKKAIDSPLSPPLVKLIDEHKLIKRVLVLIPAISEKLDLSKDDNISWVKNIVDFIQNYADKFHHAKEEDILFAHYDQSLDIIQVMLKDHVSGRSYAKSMLEAVEEQNTEKARVNLLKYRDLLTEHIKKEDEILYPWMDRNMDITTVGKMYSQFMNVDTMLPDVPQKYLVMVEEFETLCE
mgnify:CR=1 FL=1